MNKDLLQRLLSDEKKINRDLYSAGSYWNYKNLRSTYHIKKMVLKTLEVLVMVSDQVFLIMKF